MALTRTTTCGCASDARDRGRWQGSRVRAAAWPDMPHTAAATPQCIPATITASASPARSVGAAVTLPAVDQHAPIRRTASGGSVRSRRQLRPGGGRCLAVEAVDDLGDVGPGGQTLLDPTRVRLGRGRRARRGGSQARATRRGARAGLAPRAATASPRRTAAPGPTGPRTRYPPRRGRAARSSGCRSARHSRPATGRPPGRPSGWWPSPTPRAAGDATTSAGIPPNVTALRTPSRVAASTIAAATVGQRNEGSGPCTTTMSRPVRPAANASWGQSITRKPPSAKCATGRVCCRSTRSVRSSVAKGSSAPACSTSAAIAPAPALPGVDPSSERHDHHRSFEFGPARNGQHTRQARAASSRRSVLRVSVASQLAVGCGTAPGSVGVRAATDLHRASTRRDLRPAAHVRTRRASGWGSTRTSVPTTTSR